MRSRAAAFAALLALPSCLGQKVVAEPAAFGKDKRAALVLLTAHPKVVLHAPAGVAGTRDFDAAPVFAAAAPVVFDALSRSPHFRLLPEKKVVESAAYAQAKASSPTYLFLTFLMPPGYRFIKDLEELGGVAQRLPADLSLTVVLYYAYSGSGQAMVMGTGAGVDASGKLVWQMMSLGVADEDLSVHAVSPETRARLYRQATANLVRNLLERLAEALKAGGAGS